MHSTWMDPLIKAQHAKRRTSAAGAALWAAERTTQSGASPRPPEDDSEFDVYILPRRRPRQRHLDALDMNDDADWEAEPADILPEIEREIGISDWIDPETGEPAEGQSPPHLEIE